MARPIGSPIRSKILQLVSEKGKVYGYELYKLYLEEFEPVSQRSIYYHLKKGVQLGELRVHSIKEEEGDYSWGAKVEKTYYTLGPKAKQ